MKKTCAMFFILLCGYLFAESWTVLIYMAADNNLYQDAQQNIRQMESAVQPADLNLVVQVDLPDAGAKRYLIKESPAQGSSSVLLERLGKIDSGSAEALQDFVKWGRKRFTAQNYMLIIWGHGNSWYKNPKWIVPDYDSGNTIFISNQELRRALSGTGHWDILLFDACLMQSIEVISEIKDFASYVIGSVDNVPNTGFPYPDIIPQLDTSPLELAQIIPDLYVDSYRAGGFFNDFDTDIGVNCSAISTARYDDFFNEFNVFCRAIRPHAPDLMPIRQELSTIMGYNGVDLKELLNALQKAGFTEADLLRDIWQEMTVKEAFSGEYFNSATASIWFPRYRFIFTSELPLYLNLDFATAGWSSVVNFAIGAPYQPLIAPELLAMRYVLRQMQLEIQAPVSPDSLFYCLVIGDQKHFFYPPAYQKNPVFTVDISGSGYYQLYAYDQSGQISNALEGSYDFDETLLPGICLYPNPVRDKLAARLFWAEDAQNRLRVEIYNQKGQLLLKKSYQPEIPSSQLYLMDIEGFSELKRGRYIIRLHLDKHSQSLGFTIL